jgi:hypothetical protein
MRMDGNSLFALNYLTSRVAYLENLQNVCTVVAVGVPQGVGLPGAGCSLGPVRLELSAVLRF